MSAYLEYPEVATGMEKVNLILVSKKGSTKECANHQTITFIFHDSKVKVAQSCPTFCDLMWPHLYSPWNSPGQNTGVGSLSLFQGIFPTQGLKPGLPHCRWILYQLSLKGSLNEEMKHWKNHRFISIITKSVIDSDKNNQWVIEPLGGNWCLHNVKVFSHSQRKGKQ